MVMLNFCDFRKSELCDFVKIPLRLTTDASALEKKQNKQLAGRQHFFWRNL